MGDGQSNWLSRTPEERFAEKFVRTGPKIVETKCWTWTGATDENGYGQIWDSKLRRVLPAHRVAFERKNGAIPKGKILLHRCDNPPCVNPDHTRIGTYRENIRDCQAKGRLNSQGGKRVPLNVRRSIQKCCVAGMTQKGAASLFGISIKTVQRFMRESKNISCR